MSFFGRVQRDRMESDRWNRGDSDASIVATCKHVIPVTSPINHVTLAFDAKINYI